MALAEDQRMDYGFIRDDERRLVVTTEGEGHMDQGFLRDEEGRLIVTGIEGGGGAKGLEEELEGSGMGVVLNGTASTARPTGFKVITWIQEEEPENAAEGDTWIKPESA